MNMGKNTEHIRLDYDIPELSEDNDNKLVLQKDILTLRILNQGDLWRLPPHLQGPSQAGHHQVRIRQTISQTHDPGDKQATCLMSGNPWP